MRGWLCSMAVVGVCAVGVQAKTVMVTFDELPQQQWEGVGPTVNGVTFINSNIDPLGQYLEWRKADGEFGYTIPNRNNPALRMESDGTLMHFLFDEPVTSFAFDMCAADNGSIDRSRR